MFPAGGLIKGYPRPSAMAIHCHYTPFRQSAKLPFDTRPLLSYHYSRQPLKTEYPIWNPYPERQRERPDEARQPPRPAA